MIVFGRRSGKRALLEWAVNTWSDWDTGAARYRTPGSPPGFDETSFHVCPVCFYRWHIAETDDGDSTQNHKRLWALIMAAPPMTGPLLPEGHFKATGCRCWRGYTSLRSA